MLTLHLEIQDFDMFCDEFQKSLLEVESEVFRKKDSLMIKVDGNSFGL